jgi:hypothetical protein
MHFPTSEGGGIALLMSKCGTTPVGSGVSRENDKADTETELRNAERHGPPSGIEFCTPQDDLLVLAIVIARPYRPSI